jgi:hypothetical protein
MTTPGNNLLSPRLRHYIEYSQGVNKRNVSDDEILKKKLVLYLRLELIRMKVENIDLAFNLSFNTS